MQRTHTAEIDPDQKPSNTPNDSSDNWTVRLLVLAVIVLIAVGLYWRFGDWLDLQQLAAQEARLREFQRAHPWMIYGGAFAIYVLVTGLSLPGAAALSLTYGWFFGLWQGVLLVSFASTTGATCAFLLSRYLFNQALRREGAYYLFTLRLIPAVPFFIINVVMGLTPMRPWTFWWVSQLGMLPGTIVYIYAGSSVPDLQTLATRGVGGILTPNVLLAFALLGLMPLLLKKLAARWKPESSGANFQAIP